MKIIGLFLILLIFYIIKAVAVAANHGSKVLLDGINKATDKRKSFDWPNTEHIHDEYISAEHFKVVSELFDSLDSGSPRLTGYGIYVMTHAIKKARVINKSRNLDGIALVGYRYLSGEYDDNYINELIISNRDFKIIVKYIFQIVTIESKQPHYENFKKTIAEQVEGAMW